jgi:hypothetical protein
MPEMIALTIRAGHHILGHREGYGHGLDSGLEHDVPGTDIYQHDGPRAGRSADYQEGYSQGYVAGLKDGMTPGAWTALLAKVKRRVAQ